MRNIFYRINEKFKLHKGITRVYNLPERGGKYAEAIFPFLD